ncbi:MAG: cytochrome c [Candidatus Acidiferrales bacterium]
MRTAIILCVVLAATASIAVRRKSATRAAQAPKSFNADLAVGRLVYDQKCEACHFSTSSEKKIGPGLAGLMRRSKFKNGMAADDGHLRRVIERGGKDMPGFRDSLKEKQIRDLIAYMKTF